MRNPVVGSVVLVTVCYGLANETVSVPGLVTRLLEGGLVDITAFPPQADSFFASSVSFDATRAENNSWSWPDPEEAAM